MQLDVALVLVANPQRVELVALQAGEGHAQVARGARVVARACAAAEAQRGGGEEDEESAHEEHGAAEQDIGRAGAQPEGEPRGAERHRHVGDAGNAQRRGHARARHHRHDLQQRAEHHLQHEAGGEEVRDGERAGRPPRDEDLSAEEQRQPCHHPEQRGGEEEADRSGERRGVVVGEARPHHRWRIRISTAPSSRKASV